MLTRKSRLSLLTPTTPKSHLPLFVFLPGMDGTGKLYQGQAERLSRGFDIRCLYIPPLDKSDWNSLVQEVINLIHGELKLKENTQVYLCGESFGGCLALKVALKTPKLLNGLILVNPASSFNQRPWLTWGIPVTKWIPDFLHRSSTVGFLPFLAALSRLEKSSSHALLKAMQSLPCDTVAWRLSLLKDFQINKQDLQRLTAKVWLIASHADRLLPSLEEAKRFKQYLPHAEMVVLPHSGHACLLEKDVKLDELLPNLLPKKQPKSKVIA